MTPPALERASDVHSPLSAGRMYTCRRGASTGRCPRRHGALERVRTSDGVRDAFVARYPHAATAWLMVQ